MTVETVRQQILGLLTEAGLSSYFVHETGGVVVPVPGDVAFVIIGVEAREGLAEPVVSFSIPLLVEVEIQAASDWAFLKAVEGFLDECPFGRFAIRNRTEDSGTIVLEHALLGAELSAATFLPILNALVGSADQLDERLHEVLEQGRRARDVYGEDFFSALSAQDRV